ncbi:MAG: CpsB/CapC family capsule biosynthesis tyrosine phosphatase [Phycisphaeraceae bacterium]
MDVHAHLIPDIDDGSRSYDETVVLVQRLLKAGYTGSVCTPHIWPQLFPNNIPARIEDLVRGLRAHLTSVGLDYTLWPGGELRLFDGVVDWMQDYGVPTLGPSRAVLCDFWEHTWPGYVDDTFNWLLANNYHPVLAHPERIPMAQGLEPHLDRIHEEGVLLQGNLRCLTGEESDLSRERARAYLTEGRYDLLALDVHRADSLSGRIDGIAVASEMIGADEADRLTCQAPRQLLSDQLGR